MLELLACFAIYLAITTRTQVFSSVYAPILCLLCFSSFSIIFEDPRASFISDTMLMTLQVRIAQGLVHMGKGLLTLNPYHSDRFLLSK
jgi:hypothetical protein